METLNIELWWCAKVRTCTGLIALVLALVILAGCSGSVKEGSSVQKGLSVERLKDGREGFIITENPSMMNAESLEDFERAVAMMKDRNYDKAIELLEKVIERSPGITAPYINIAIAYGRIDKLEPAEEHLKTALGLVPGHPVVSNEYGLLLRKSGRFAEAREIYENTLKIFPEYLPAHRNLGILCDLYLNDQACALEQYEIYSEAKPEDEQVKLWVADLSMRLGR
jgi:Tfp pilus assembly protein PilF